MQKSDDESAPASCREARVAEHMRRLPRRWSLRRRFGRVQEDSLDRSSRSAPMEGNAVEGAGETESAYRATRGAGEATLIGSEGRQRMPLTVWARFRSDEAIRRNGGLYAQRQNCRESS